MSAHGLPPLPLSARLRSNLLQAPLFFLATAVFGSLALAVSLFEKNSRVQHAIARLWARTSLWIVRAPVTVSGLDPIASLGPAVYASNHTSFMDTPAVFASLPFQFRILARQSLWSWPFIGWYLNRSGQIPINMDGPGGSVAGLTRAVKALRSGMPLFIFPEGGRTPDGSLQPFLNGPAFLAIRAQTPLVPMAIAGAFELLPMHTHHFRPGPIRIEIGEPIPTEGLSIRQADALTARLHEAVAALRARGGAAPETLHAEVEP